MKEEYSEEFIKIIIRMAWADAISFDKIKRDMGINESEVIKIMRKNLNENRFKIWRQRVSGRKSKHEKRTKLLEQDFN